MKSGTVYTETIVHAPPEQYAAEAPYQLVIVALDEGGRVTGRVLGERLMIGDPVELGEERNGVLFFRQR